MGKSLKISLKSKKSAVLSVQSGRETCVSAAKKLGCHRSTVQNWMVLYRHHGLKGLSLPVRTYSAAFKIEVIDHLLKNRLSLMRTAAYFGIPGGSVVAGWKKIYDRDGYWGFQKQRSTRKKTVMAKKKTKKDSTSDDAATKKLAALQKEVEYLRAENAFLKKLDALIQEEEAAKAKNRQHKSSGN